jgi:signal transduction histidine kinase
MNAAIWDRWDAWRAAHIAGIDLVTGLMLTAFMLIASSGQGTLAVLFSILLALPLTRRRKNPVGSTAAVMLIAFVQWVAAVAQWMIDSASGSAAFGATLLLLPADVCIFIALFSIAIHGPTWAIATATGGAALGAVIDVWPWFSGDRLAVIVMGWLAVISSVALGAQVRSRREKLSTALERARLVESERTQQVQLALGQERARIARELHDIVAHSLAVIIIQADGGRYAAIKTPEAATMALEVVAATGRSALADMRRLLGVLRDDQHPADAAAPTTPPPGPGDLQPLVDSVVASGVQVTLTTNDPPNRIDEGLGLTVYRIVQEALTNVLRHAGPAAKADVVIIWSEGLGGVTVTVTDDGRGAAAVPTESGGHGLIGMRERVEVFGGTVRAGPQPGGGFAVHAVILPENDPLRPR